MIVLINWIKRILKKLLIGLKMKVFRVIFLSKMGKWLFKSNKLSKKSKLLKREADHNHQIKKLKNPKRLVSQKKSKILWVIVNN